MQEIRSGQETHHSYEFFTSETGEFGDRLVSTTVSLIEYVPTHDNERVIAHTEGGVLSGCLLVVKKLPATVGGEDIVVPVGEHGQHEVIIGEPYLGMIDGIEPTKLYRLIRNQFTETLPES